MSDEHRITISNVEMLKHADKHVLQVIVDAIEVYDPMKSGPEHVMDIRNYDSTEVEFLELGWKIMNEFYELQGFHYGEHRLNYEQGIELPARVEDDATSDALDDMEYYFRDNGIGEHAMDIVLKAISDHMDMEIE